MVYRVTIVVNTVCAMELRIWSLSVIETGCQSQSRGSDGSRAHAAVADRAQAARAIWRQYTDAAPTIQAITGTPTPCTLPASLSAFVHAR